MSEMTPAEMGAEMLRLSKNIDSGISHLVSAVRECAEAEAEYRKATAQAWVSVDSSLLAAQRQAGVEARTSEMRKARDIAEGMKRAAIESIRARQSQLSALQSLMSAHRAEAEFARTAPQ